MATPLEPQFDVHAEPAEEGACFVVASGELHVTTAPALAAHLASIGEDGTDKVIVDLTGVQFIDSTGLGTLLSAMRDLDRRGSRMAVVCNNPTVLRLFSITGTDVTLRVRPSRDAALRDLAG